MAELAGRCFRDRALLRDLDAAYVLLEGGGREACVAHCRARGLRFASVQASERRPSPRTTPAATRCFCGDTFGRHGALPAEDCRASRCAGGAAEFCGGWRAATVLRTGVDKRAPKRAAHAIAALCSPGYSCYELHVHSLRAYAARHALDLHLHDGPLEPDFPVPFSKLTVLQRLARLAYRWIWWIDCDTLLLDPSVGMAQLLAAHGVRDGVSGNALLLGAYEPWGWIKEHGEPPGHPINTGSFFLRGGAAGEALLNEWVDACPAVRGHALWEQQALWHILGSERVGGGERRALALRNGTIRLFANPAFNSFLCPTERTLARPPVLLHVVRGEVSTGRCSPEVRNPKRKARALLRQPWKGVLLSRVALDGLQSVRDRCCGGHDFSERLYKRLWGGAIGAANASDVWPREIGRATAFGDVPVREVARRLSVCGVAGDVAPVEARLACANRSWWPAPRRPGGKGKGKGKTKCGPGCGIEGECDPSVCGPRCCEYWERQHAKRRRAKGR